MDLGERLSPQNVFNSAWQAFIVENKPPCGRRGSSNTNTLLCRYKEGNAACAIGLCLTDEEAEVFSNVDLLTGMRNLNLSEKDYHCLKGLQLELHDKIARWNDGPVWHYNLEQRRTIYERFAERWNLTVPTVSVSA